MLENLQSQTPLIWLGIAVLLAIVEVAVPSFGFIFGTGAALITAAVTVFGPVGWPMQIATFAITLLLGLFLLRPRLVAKMQGSKDMPSRTDALIGKKGKVIQAVDPTLGSGRVIIEGDDWACRSRTPISEGADVVVENADGIILLVKEV